MTGAAGGGAASAAAAIALAIKASGALVRIEPGDFEELVQRIPHPLVLHQGPRGVLSRKHQYATSYRGFVFFARTRDELFLPDNLEMIEVKTIWIPG
ncbi:hypothetical protein BH23GEM9_BH23GEM9_26130 [soil metagenome]